MAALEQEKEEPLWKQRLLAQYRAQTDEERAAIKKASARKTEEIFKTLVEAKVATQRERHESYREIPKFFGAKRGLRERLERCANARYITEKERRLPSWDALDAFREALSGRRAGPKRRSRIFVARSVGAGRAPEHLGDVFANFGRPGL